MFGNCAYFTNICYSNMCISKCSHNGPYTDVFDVYLI